MESLNIDPISAIVLTAAVIGAVALVRAVFAGQWETVAIIVVAAVVGAVFASPSGDVTWFQGMLVGLNASGVVTLFQNVGKKVAEPVLPSEKEMFKS